MIHEVRSLCILLGEAACEIASERAKCTVFTNNPIQHIAGYVVILSICISEVQNSLLNLDCKCTSGAYLFLSSPRWGLCE